MTKYILLATILALSGCSTADTNGPVTERLYRAPIDIDSGGGDVNLTVNLNASSDAETASTQSPRNTAETPTEIDLNLRDLNNPVSTMTEVLERKADTKIIKQAEEIDNEKVEVLDNDDAEGLGDVIDTLSMKSFEDKSMVWLPQNGKRYPKSVTFTFDNDCGSFTVPDMTKAGAEDGSTDRNQRFYYPGDWPDQDRSMACMDGCASVFTAQGCVAQTVTLTEN